MTPEEIAEDARRGIGSMRALGVTITLGADAGLTVRGPADVVTPALLALLAERKAVVVAILRSEDGGAP